MGVTSVAAPKAASSSTARYSSIARLARRRSVGKLVQAITSGEFQPGQKLSEAQLARQLGISRGPLREALGRLDGRLVMRTPRICVRVINFSYEGLEQLFLIREALEGTAARLVADESARDVLHGRDGISVLVERGLDEHERGIDVRVAGIERGQNADFGGLHCSGSSWPAKSIAQRPGAAEQV